MDEVWGVGWVKQTQDPQTGGTGFMSRVKQKRLLWFYMNPDLLRGVNIQTVQLGWGKLGRLILFLI